jgi:hypothetical protein
MAFIVEDGTGLANANSYASVADTNVYFAERGQSAWTGTDEAKEQLLVLATDYIELRWGQRLLGVKEFPSVQFLSFPRTGIDGYTGIPVCLKRATAEYALLAKSGKLAPEPVFDVSGKTVEARRTKVGPIETDISFAKTGPGAVAPTFRPYPTADALMRPLLAPSGGNRVIR